MVKKKSKTMRIILLLMSFSIILSMFAQVFASTNESYEYAYTGIVEWGDGDNGSAIIELQDESGNKYQVYCIDEDVYVTANQKYSLENLEESTYFDTENASKIRTIVMNAYPYITLEKLSERTGIKDLTTKQAISGTQSAIWHYSNDNTEISLTGNAKTLYDWYLNLSVDTSYTAKIADIDIKQETHLVDNKYEIIISYKASEQNVDGSEINLSYIFDKDIEKDLNAQVEVLGKNSNGYQTIRISNLDKDSEFKITVQGTQTLTRNAYFYTPKDGKASSQSLVGVRDDKTHISASQAITPQISGHSLTLNKIDAKDLSNIPGAQFEIASDKDFTQNVRTVTTGQDGKVTICGLASGQWYVREILAPSGYIPCDSIIDVYINEVDIQLDIKNSKFGKAEILKIDECKNPIEGAKFILYKDSVDDKNIIYNNLISDKEGKILVDNLLPGNYILLETETPDDYILNSEEISFSIDAYETKTISHVNETKGYGIIKIYKRDVVTKEQLGGAVIGIYSDPDYQNLIQEVTTKADEAITIDTLRPGTYYIKELKAVDGYLLDSAPKTITIEKNQTVEVTFYNSQNHSTAGNYATLAIVGAVLLSLSFAALIINKNLSRRKHV